MSNDAQVAFEHGKTLFEEENFSEAVSAFAKVVRLEPQNAEYHAWLARALTGDNEFSKAMEEVTRAIQLDPASGFAYYVRSFTYDRQDEYNKALVDVTKAIELGYQNSESYRLRAFLYAVQNELEDAIQDATKALELAPNDLGTMGIHLMVCSFLGDHVTVIKQSSHILEIDPHNASAYQFRAESYEALNDFENAISDIAKYHQLETKRNYLETFENQQINLWYRTIFQHFADVLLPQLKNSNEGFVDFWPSYFAWGFESQQTMMKGTSYLHSFGSYGTGYLCITDKNTRLLSFGRLSQQVPLFKPKGGLESLGSLVMAAAGLSRSFEHIEPEKQDKVWTVPNNSITGVHSTENHIMLTIPAMSWYLYPSFGMQMPFAALNMAMRGKLEGICSIQKIAGPSAADTSPVELLKQLAHLRDQGILTEQEFQAKKSEILKRM